MTCTENFICDIFLKFYSQIQSIYTWSAAIIKMKW